MTTISDVRHHSQDIVFQGVIQQPIATVCDDTVLLALKQWEMRVDVTDPLANHFQFYDTRSFTISYRGECANFWPDENMNVVGETLIRDFLFPSGICVLHEMTPRLYFVKYKIQAMDDSEYLLVCPYPTAANNVSGLLIVCINNHVRGKA